MKVISTVQDPVCGMDIDSHEAYGEVSYQGHTYSFCGPDCKTKFEADPAKYAKAEAGSATPKA